MIYRVIYSHPINFFLVAIIMFVFPSMFTLQEQDYTRGVGIYPGDVREDFSPVMHIDKTTYRHLTLLIPDYHKEVMMII